MEYLKVDGFDDAIIGIDMVGMRIVYDKFIMCEVLTKQGWLEEDAIKFLAYNVWGTYVGEYTPIYVDLMGVSNFERIMNIPHNNFDFQK